MPSVQDSKPVGDSVSPAISFAVDVELQRNRQVLFKVDGWLRTNSGSIISRLHEDSEGLNNSQDILARGTELDHTLSGIEKITVNLVALLNPSSLHMIDEARLSDSKHDLNLKLELFIKYLSSNALVSPNFGVDLAPFMDVAKKVTVLDSTGRPREAKLLAYAPVPSFSSPCSNGWIISGNNGPAFLRVEGGRVEIQHRIPAQDWIHDYAPKLGLGNFITFGISTAVGFYAKAQKYIEEARKALLRWDTKGVFSNCREVGTALNGELLRKFGKGSFTYEERWRRAYERFSHWASLDLHEVEIGSKYASEELMVDAADAENLFYSTIILIKLAEDLAKDQR